MENLYKIIFDDNTSEKEKAAANIELEKVMKEVEKCPEFIEERKKQDEEWRKINEPLNEQAFNEVMAALKALASSDPEAFKARAKKSPELLLILLPKETILKRHESDFKTYTLMISEKELRALRHAMPKFRSDQKVQISFVDSIENKIREQAKAAEAPPPPKPAAKKRAKKWQPKKASSGGSSFIDELKKRQAKN
eukprot:TRINITY_DN4073_c0_g1_i1.p1 TRINITY_DN4073_c0_g1~~TRINITY_DN4073_c0_g1_i1.p1  ORF type:complete len:213 (+),score=57.81 TRINITY_DN4073_c0_g1_i1:55-639(+)